MPDGMALGPFGGSGAMSGTGETLVLPRLTAGVLEACLV